MHPRPRITRITTHDLSIWTMHHAPCRHDVMLTVDSTQRGPLSSHSTAINHHQPTMHGKKRADYKAKLGDPKTAAVLSAKAEQWHQLVQELAKRRRSDDKQNDNENKTTMVLLEKALLVNPDPLHLWNHRRERIVLLVNNDDDDDDSSAAAAAAAAAATLQTELTLTQAALQRNPKAYGAWMHRKWIVQHAQASSSVLQSELALTAQFLKLDERNFHCWNYRRFVVGCLSAAAAADSKPDSILFYTGQWATPAMGIQLVPSPPGTLECPITPPPPITNELLQTEWEFTAEKIQENFSNFSAFYYRSQILPGYLGMVADDARLYVWQEELQLIENAVCTEPDDQTAWWYQALLFSYDDTVFPLEPLRERLLEQGELLRELLEDSPNSKWVLLGLHRLLEKLQIEFEEQRQILQKLQQVDPDRSQRYQELLDSIVVE
jgi:geranylgeranyl transferase type-2 subunit alpha